MGKTHLTSGVTDVAQPQPIKGSVTGRSGVTINTPPRRVGVCVCVCERHHSPPHSTLALLERGQPASDV